MVEPHVNKQSHPRISLRRWGTSHQLLRGAVQPSSVERDVTSLGGMANPDRPRFPARVQTQGSFEG